MSASEAHAAVRRLGAARLLHTGTREVERAALEGFLVQGVPFAFAVRPMELVRGTPTGLAASILGAKLAWGRAPPPVWPDPDGDTEGCAVEPLYPSVPRAARRDPALYALLALVDAFRLEGPEGAGAARPALAARLRLGTAS